MRLRTASVIIATTALVVAGLPATPPAQALTAGQIKDRISALRRTLGTVTARLNVAERALTEAHVAIARHEKALRLAAERRAGLSRSLSQRAADIYMYGGLRGIDAGIAVTDLSTYVDRLAYLDQLQSGEEGLLEDIRALQRRATEETGALQRARSVARENAAELAEQQQQLATQLRELTRLNNFLDSVGRGSRRASRGPVRGVLCPVVGATVVANNFGDPRPGGPHQGNDLRGDTGQPVRAVLPGTIVQTPFGNWWGIGIVLRDLAGNEWWYAHLSTESVSPGERVSQGELIGKVGCTGTCFGPHLHFEYHPGGGNAVDPYRILSSAC